MPKIGIEIHQRLSTHKLFCNCLPIEGEPSLKVERYLHVAYSETGEVDKAAMFESSKQKKYIYNYFPKSSCLVELDEEPPHEINEEGVIIALAIALQLNMKVFDKAVVMRKIVIDGSNTTGFQRTALLAIDGNLDGVPIQTLCIEEESAGIVKEGEGFREFRLDRLGIPLVEIATAPVITSGKEAKDVAEKLGILMRATGGVARGIGTIRQDLNVSIEGGARVEIKGAQELNMIPKWIDNEVKRQKSLLDVIKRLKERQAYSKLKYQVFDVSECFEPKGFVKKALEKGKAYLLPLPSHKGLLGKEIGPNRRYGTELSDYAKQAGVKGIIHSDEDLTKYGLDDKCLRKRVGLSKEDGYAIVIEREEIAEKALKLLFQRAKMDFVPKETRKALPNGSTAYMRPLPTSARMYPETDVPLVDLKELVKRAEPIAKKGYAFKLQRLKSLLNEELSKRMIKSKYLTLFESLVEEGINPKIVAITLEDTLTSLRRERVDVKMESVTKALRAYREGIITKAAIREVIRRDSEGKDWNELKRIRKEEIYEMLKKGKDPKAIIKEFKLKVEPKEVFELAKTFKHSTQNQ